jgi:hypothetical protein
MDLLPITGFILIGFVVYKYLKYDSIGSTSFLNSKAKDLTENQKMEIYLLWSELTGINLNLELRNQFFENSNLLRISKYSVKRQKETGKKLVGNYKNWDRNFDEKPNPFDFKKWERHLDGEPKPLDLKKWADLLDSTASKDFHNRNVRAHNYFNPGDKWKYK